MSDGDIKVLDVTSRLPGRAGEASDAVFVYTQVKMKGDPKPLNQNLNVQ